MEPVEYEERVVTRLDSEVQQDFGDDNKPGFIQRMLLLLQDVETNMIFQTVLQEEDVRKIIRADSVLSSKQMIDLAIALRSRDEPVKLMVPKSKTDLTARDIEHSRVLDKPVKRKRRRYRNKKKKTANSVENNRKVN